MNSPLLEDTEKEEEKEKRSAEQLEKQVQFERALREVSSKILSSNLDEIILEVKNDISDLLDGERVTMYLVDRAKDEIYSKFADGDEVKEFRVPISTDSIAGFVASEREPVRIQDAYDEEELTNIHDSLKFDQSWDRQTGFRTREVLAAPIEKEDVLHGVIQVVNKEDEGEFTERDLEIVQELSNSLAIAFRNQKRIQGQKSRFDGLLKRNLIEPEQINEAREIAQEKDCSMEQVLVDEFEVPREQVGESLEEYYRVPYIPFDADREIPVELIEDLEVSILKHHRWVPISKDENEIVIAMENPKDIQIRDEIDRWHPGPINFCVSTREEIFAYIDFFFGDEEEEKGGEITEEAIDDILGDLEEEDLDLVAAKKEEEEEDEVEEYSEDDSAIVRLVNQIIVQGYKQGASDIHFEPYEDDDMRIRFRIDGICQEYTRVPKHYAKAIISRIKIMSGLDIAERRMPQDGKIKFKNYGPLDIELRVATLPTSGGKEDAVLRILAGSGSNLIKIEDIGMREPVLNTFKNLIKKPHGIVLCVGPTGSGKTTTLHAALRHINDDQVKTWTAEDPVEITQEGLRQLEVKESIGLTFPRAMRAFLRGDPDIIMIGEMRDKETTSTAVEASLTGHMVFSTLHTNTAPETITRLLDLGIDPYSFGDALQAILAQRLVRTFCDHCKKETTVSDKQWNQFREEFGDKELFEEYAPDREEVDLYEVVGCDRCNRTGYSGRTAIHELLSTSEQIKKLIYESARADEIKDVAHKEGMLTLKQDGIIKVMRGDTDLQEVKRVSIS